MSEQHSGCGKAQEAPVLLTHSRTTLLACLEELRNRIEQKNGVRCVTAAEALESAQTPKAVSTPAQQDIFKAMMEIEAAKKRAVIANKASLEAEQEKDAAEKELEILKSRLGQKRARLPDAAEEEDDDGVESVSDWDLAAHRREATRVQNRRVIELGSRENMKKLRRGEVGYLAHPRLGLLGWVPYWSRGSKDIVFRMMVSLGKKLNLAADEDTELRSRCE